MSPNASKRSLTWLKKAPRWPSWNQDGEVGAKIEPTWPQVGAKMAKLEPRWSQHGGGPLPVLCPVLPQQCTLPPSSDSSPLVKPLRGAPVKHRTPRQSQSFPEQQTSVLSQQKTSILSQQKTRQLPAAGPQLLCLLLKRIPVDVFC